MRKIYIKVVLDVFVKADESIANPESFVIEDMLSNDFLGSCGPASDVQGVSIEGVELEHYEIADSR